jgi:hypothetical protein
MRQRRPDFRSESYFDNLTVVFTFHDDARESRFSL